MVDDIFIGVELPEGVDLKQHERKYLFRSLFRWRKNQHDPTEQLSVSGLNKGKYKAGVSCLFFGNDPYDRNRV